jgi:hypothetical protein
MATTTDHRTLGRIGILASAALMALTAMSIVVMPAAARHGADDGRNSGVEREKHGVCSGRGDWELELEKEDGRIEVKVQVDGDRAGRLWSIRIHHDGTLVTSILRRANDRGRIIVERDRANHQGADTFRFRAVDQVSGQVCAGSLSI